MLLWRGWPKTFVLSNLSFVKKAQLKEVSEDVDGLVKLYTIAILEDQPLNVFVLGRKVNADGLGLSVHITGRNIKLAMTTICHGLNKLEFVEHLRKKKGQI